MKLSGQSIRKRTGMILPFAERTRAHGMTFGLGPAGYDVRIAETIILPPQGFCLASTMEKFNMPNDLIAGVKDKSTWVRQGLTVQNTVIEPGWRGFLTLELINHGMIPIMLSPGMPIAQILFELLDEPAEIPYSGKYQDQASGAQTARFE